MQRLEHQRGSERRKRIGGISRCRLAAIVFAAFAAMLGLSQAGQAQDHWRHERHWPGRWRAGYWYHGWHGGRYGWWWVAPGFGWTFYAAPVYPYPEPPPPAVAPPPPAPATWYYCPNPPGYYPYVAQCYGPWRPVPAH